MQNIIFETNRIRVRKLTYSDIPIITRWWNNGLLMKDMGFINGMGVTESSLYSRFKNQLSDDGILKVECLLLQILKLVRKLVSSSMVNLI